MTDTPHNAISDGDTITSNEARIVCVKLFLDLGKEGAPLSMTNFCEPLSLLCSIIEAKENGGIGRDELAPSLNYPVNQTGLLPVGWIIVAFLDADGAENGSELLHVSALVADDWQLSHLSCIATCFPYTPAWQADIILSPLSVAMVQEDSKGLSSPVYFEVRDSDDCWVRWTATAGVSHYDLFFILIKYLSVYE